MAVGVIEEKSGKKLRVWLAITILLFLFGSAAAWRWTPLSEQIDLHKMASWAFSVRDHPARTPIILGAYLLGSLLLVPITVLIAATAIAFGPMLGSIYSLAGSLLGAGVTYALGYLLGKDFVRRIAGRRWNALERRVGQSGIVAVATLRLIPIAPFTIVNVASGAFGVSVLDYTVGSLLGLLPGIVVINVFEHQIESAFRNPGPGSFAILAALVVLSIWMFLWLRGKLGGNNKAEE